MARIKKNAALGVLAALTIVLVTVALYILNHKVSDGSDPPQVNGCPVEIASRIGYSSLDEMANDAPSIVRGRSISESDQSTRFKIEESLHGNFRKGDVIDICPDYAGGLTAVLFLSGQHKGLWAPLQGAWGVLAQDDTGKFTFGTSTSNVTPVTLDEIKQAIARQDNGQ